MQDRSLASNKSCFPITGSIFHTVITKQLFLTHSLMFIYRLDLPDSTDNTLIVEALTVSLCLLILFVFMSFFLYIFMRLRRRNFRNCYKSRHNSGSKKRKKIHENVDNAIEKKPEMISMLIKEK